MSDCVYTDGRCSACGVAMATPRLKRNCVPASSDRRAALFLQWPACLAGSSLKSLLSGFPFYISHVSECSCRARAAQMDAKGCEWCEANIDTIVGWLREEAEKRGLPFLDVVGRLLVRRSIRNARRAASNAGNTVS